LFQQLPYVALIDRLIGVLQRLALEFLRSAAKSFRVPSTMQGAPSLLLGRWANGQSDEKVEILVAQGNNGVDVSAGGDFQQGRQDCGAHHGQQEGKPQRDWVRDSDDSVFHQSGRQIAARIPTGGA